jgi:hypothetical protein
MRIEYDELELCPGERNFYVDLSFCKAYEWGIPCSLVEALDEA